MTKAELERILIEEHGFKKKDLRDDRGNPFVNSKLEKMVEDAESKKDKPKEKPEKNKKEKREPEVEQEPEEEDIFGIDETVFETRHNLKDDDLVLCMSGINGDLRIVSQLSNFTATTARFGQTIKIPYKDLSYLHNVSHKAFEDGTIVVLNKDVQEEFGLTEAYKNVLTPKNIDRVMKMDADKLRDFISKLPESMKTSLYAEAKSRFDRDEIDSRGTIQVFEDEYGISFKDNAPISEKINK